MYCWNISQEKNWILKICISRIRIKFINSFFPYKTIEVCVCYICDLPLPSRPLICHWTSGLGSRKLSCLTEPLFHRGVGFLLIRPTAFSTGCIYHSLAIVLFSFFRDDSYLNGLLGCNIYNSVSRMNCD